MDPNHKHKQVIAKAVHKDAEDFAIQRDDLRTVLLCVARMPHIAAQLRTLAGSFSPSLSAETKSRTRSVYERKVRLRLC